MQALGICEERDCLLGVACPSQREETRRIEAIPCTSIGLLLTCSISFNRQLSSQVESVTAVGSRHQQGSLVHACMRSPVHSANVC